MSNDQNDKVSRGRHVAPSDIPSIYSDNDNQPGGFIPQQVHGQQTRQAYPQYAQNGHQGYAPSGMQIPPTGVSRPKKRVGKVLGIVAACLVGVLAIAYCGVALYFGSHFMPNTKIGNLDASLMSTADAEKALANEVNSYKLTITGNGFNLSCAGDVTCACTVQEEIGTRGAITSAFGVRPDVAVAFDVTHATDYPGISHAKFGDIKCGGGPVIGRGPNVNPQVFERLVQAAKTAGVPYQVEALPGHSGTDAWPIQVSRAGIPTGLVSVPLRYMHTPTEVICLDDLDATVALFAQFARDLESGGSFVPMAGCGSASLDASSARAAQGE